MGSWTELDANYPPGTLTPAAAMIVALGHLAGARSVYADADRHALAAFLPTHGLIYDLEVLTRAERYLDEVPVEAFLEQARAILNPEQRRCLMLNLLDRILAQGVARPEKHVFFGQALESLGMTVEQLQPYWQALVIKNDLSVFPQ
jgi:hypothetical protein